MMFLWTLLALVVSPWAAYGQQDTRTIMEFINDEGLVTLSGFVTGTGLNKILGDPSAPAMTLFAPTEDAWTKIPSNVLISLATNSTALKSVLLDHVIDQIVLGQYVRDGDSKKNFNGETLTFKVYPNRVKTVNGAVLVGTDHSLANGVVHMIDSILLMPETSIGEYIAQHETDFKDLFGLLVLGRLFGPLETSGPYTMFAPVDQAFETIRDTVTELINNRTALTDVLEYHVVPDTYWSVGLSDGMKLPTLNGAELTVSVGIDGVKIDNAKVIQADIATSNGVIHVLDSVVVPGAPLLP